MFDLLLKKLASIAELDVSESIRFILEFIRDLIAEREKNE